MRMNLQRKTKSRDYIGIACLLFLLADLDAIFNIPEANFSRSHESEKRFAVEVATLAIIWKINFFLQSTYKFEDLVVYIKTLTDEMLYTQQTSQRPFNWTGPMYTFTFLQCFNSSEENQSS